MKPRLSIARAVFAASILSGLLAASAWAQQAPERVPTAGASPNGLYIVQMADDPVVAYNGGIKGLKATKPAKGSKINPASGDVTRYVDYLTARHDRALSKAGGKKVYDYYYAFNGFAAKMTPGQARKLAKLDGVKSVTADERLSVDTVTTPHFLGLDAPDGLWAELGGVGSAGEDIIIGMVDSGVWPESLSFSDRTGTNGNGRKDGKLSYQQIPGWHGKCTPGEAFTAANCNQKLIGARYYNSGWGGNAQIDALFPFEFNSPRDWGGHGTHTASTAGGNNDTPTTGLAAVLGNTSGIAPRARIAAYKVCWADEPTGGGCFGSDSVAAIDQAVADGVDVINFSISGTRTNFLDAVEVAFLFAADAGVFVAASAGNSGPGASTVAHPSPWITTVAASTHDRYSEAEVTLGNGSSYTGASTNVTGAGPAPLVYSANVGLAGEDPTEVRLCYPGTLDPAQVSGKIVLCDRGVIARVDKSLAVYMAGGIGMVHANTSASSINADLHSVPTVHVDVADGDAIRTYATSDPSPTAEILPSYPVALPAPLIASFSSRGPLLGGNGDLLKPDVSAPGVDILASVAPPGNAGLDFASYQGTSMSSPHVAGLGALFKDLHPDWSPMEIKSALMTTAFDLLSGADPFAQGAGHVDPNAAMDPGLVFDHSFIDWLAFLCGTGQLTASYCPSIAIDPSDLNVASIAIGALAGSQTVWRTVKNVSDVTETYDFADSVPGVDVAANPASFTIAPGETLEIELTLTATTAPVGAYAKGSVSWNGDQGHSVRIPVAVLPLAVSVPAELHGSGTDGSLSFDVTFGYTGDYTAAAHGLEPATKQAGTVADDPTNDFNTALGTCNFSGFPASPPYDCVGITWHYVTVPPGTALTRISLFNEYTDGNDDLDLNVYTTTGSLVGSSGSGTSAEEVNIFFPNRPSYLVAVHGWQTDGADSNYTLFDWSVSATPGGNLMIDSAPTDATLGATGSIDISWSGIEADTKHLGAVSHSDGGGLLDLTVIAVDTD